MKLLSLLLPLAAAAPSPLHINPAVIPEISSSSSVPRRGCGSTDPSARNLVASAQLASSTRGDVSLQVFNETTSLDVDVYFHIIGNDDSVLANNTINQAIADQFIVLNEDYAPANIRFHLADVTRTQNASWFEMSMHTTQESEMKRLLRQGSYKDVNVYFLYLSRGTLGWCTFPEETPTPDEVVDDGCVVGLSSLPRIGKSPYNLGRTLTHELGHWFNLYHPFQGGCSGDGDMVDDTPAQRGPQYGCPANVTDSCPGEEYPGTDPLHNFMAYTDDGCMSEFTPGQITRMHQSFASFRDITTTPAENTTVPEVDPVDPVESGIEAATELEEPAASATA